MSDKTDWKLEDLSRRDRGEIARRAFFEHQETLGNTFKRRRGRHHLYFLRTCDSVILGITYSEDSGDKWFFNLQEGLFQEAVLLCQSGPRSVRAVHLPKQFLDIYLRQLSKRKVTPERGNPHNEVYFNITKDGQKWLLNIPEPTGKQDVTRFVDTPELVCDRYVSDGFI